MCFLIFQQFSFSSFPQNNKPIYHMNSLLFWDFFLKLIWQHNNNHAIIGSSIIRLFFFFVSNWKYQKKKFTKSTMQKQIVIRKVINKKKKWNKIILLLLCNLNKLEMKHVKSSYFLLLLCFSKYKKVTLMMQLLTFMRKLS